MESILIVLISYLRQFPEEAPSGVVVINGRKEREEPFKEFISLT